MVSSAFLYDQLDYLQKEVVEQEFPEMLMASGKAIDISNEVPAGAETYSYKILTILGEAKILANGASDIPLVSMEVEKRTGYIRTIADGYEVTDDDLEAAELVGMNVDAENAKGCREVMERKFDNLLYLGDDKFNLLGLLNLPNVPRSTVPNDGAGGLTTFASKTAAQIYRDIRVFCASIRVATNRAETPNILALPEEQFGIVMETPYPDGANASETIGSFFLKTQSYSMGGIESIVPMPFLEGKGTGGLDMMVAYRKRASKLKAHLAMDFSMKPAQPKDLCYKTICRMKTGGVQNTKPLSIAYKEGI